MIKFHLRGVQELFWRAGRSTEKSTFRRLIKKHPTQAKRALNVAQQKGLRKVQALGKRHGVEGLGVGTGIKTIKKFKPSRIRPRHLRGKDFPDIADDPTIGGVKAYADFPSIKARASKEAGDVMHMWGKAGRPVSELAPELHAGRKHYSRLFSKPGSKTYKKLSKGWRSTRRLK
jgi:hypothetical protein